MTESLAPYRRLHKLKSTILRPAFCTVMLHDYILFIFIFKSLNVRDGSGQ